MNKKVKLILVAVAFIFYVFDALLYFFFHVGELSFVDALITAVPAMEIVQRFLLIFALLLSGFVSIYFTGRTKVVDFKDENGKPVPKSTVIDANFISSLNYQVRTPLNAMVGFSELLKDPDTSHEKRVEFVDQITRSGENLIQLMNNLSDILKIEAGQVAMKKSELRLNDLLDEIGIKFTKRIEQSGKPFVEFNIIKARSDQGFVIDADADRLKEVFLNLLENALKKTEKGSIEMGYILKQGTLIEFYVKDTGSGYSMEYLKNVFQRYLRLSDQDNHPFDGTALRFTISKSLIKLMGGKIRGISESGKGAVFYFTIPYTERPRARRRNGSGREKDVLAKASTVKDWSKNSILIAEDVESNFIYLREILKPTKVNLIWAQNGLEAVQQVRTNKDIELVLMDILMPEMDGIEASKSIKELRPDLPVIAQTAYNLDGHEDQSELEGFSEFLTKPIWSPKLMSTVEKYIS